MVTIKFPATVGFLYRGSFTKAVKDFCFRYDVEILQFDEDKRLLDSTYYIKLKGDTGVIFSIKDWLEKLSNEK